MPSAQGARKNSGTTLYRILGCALAAGMLARPALAGDDKQPEHKITQSESFLMLAPMYATVLDAGRPSGLLMVAIGLDIPNAHLRDEAQSAMPLLRDYYVRSLMIYTEGHVRPWQQPDVFEIADRLQRVTDRALRKKGARVLLAQVALRVTK